MNKLYSYINLCNWKTYHFTYNVNLNLVDKILLDLISIDYEKSPFSLRGNGDNS